MEEHDRVLPQVPEHLRKMLFHLHQMREGLPWTHRPRRSTEFSPIETGTSSASRENRSGDLGGDVADVDRPTGPNGPLRDEIGDGVFRGEHVKVVDPARHHLLLAARGEGERA
jgi:hypothetical protein